MIINIKMIPKDNDKKITDVLYEYIKVSEARISLPLDVMVDPAPVYPQGPLVGILKSVKNKLIGGVIKVTGALNDDTANSILKVLKPVFEKKLTEYLVENNIPAIVSIDNIIKEENSLRITSNVDSSFDYGSLVVKFLPSLTDSLKGKDPNNIIWTLYDVIKADQEKIIGAIFDSLSVEQRDEIAKILIEHFNQAICIKISEYFDSQEINLAIKDLDVA